MPLAFGSFTHGRVAFGFYNVETDSLLLEEIFFFCTDFCRAAVRLLEEPAVEVPGHVFDRREEIGDLMGAIHGVRHEGYLGEIYRTWPFPKEPSGFRQKLHGHRNRAAVEAVLDRWARKTAVRLERDRVSGHTRIGPYGFTDAQFRELLAYVYRGGYPTWERFERGECPPWVREMARAWGIGLQERRSP